MGASLMHIQWLPQIILLLIVTSNLWKSEKFSNSLQHLHLSGRHDGTVKGVRYFAAGKDRGVFVTQNKVTKLGQDENFNESYDNISECLSPAPSSVTMSTSAMTMSHAQPPVQVRRSLSLRHQERKSNSSSTSTPAPSSSMTSSVTTLTPSRTVSRWHTVGYL